MFSYLLAFAMFWAPPADGNEARKAYSRCLNDLVETNSQKRIPVEEFDPQVSTACAAKAQAFRSAMIAADVARGISRKSAEEGVDSEIVDFETAAKEDYRLFVDPPRKQEAQPAQQAQPETPQPQPEVQQAAQAQP